MNAAFDGQDYMIILDDIKNEWSQLGQRGAVLTAPLMRCWSAEQWPDKTVHMRVEENKGRDGIEVTYAPENADTWENIREIHVAIAWRTHMLLVLQRSLGTRYNGSDKIEIFMNDPAQQ